MPAPDFSLPAEVVSKLFPFHLVFDCDGRIIQIGSSLHRICPEASVGTRMDHSFRLKHPTKSFQFEAIREHSQSMFVLECLRTATEYKGQMVWIKHSEWVLFIGFPRITDLKDIKDIGLTLADFPPHTFVGDFFPLLQMEKMAMSDVRRLNDKLNSQLKISLLGAFCQNLIPNECHCRDLGCRCHYYMNIDVVVLKGLYYQSLSTQLVETDVDGYSFPAERGYRTAMGHNE